MRELEREVTARLARAPTGEPRPRGEETRERDETVVPIVITGNRVDVWRRRLGIAQRSFVRRDESLIVFFAARGRIDFVAAEDQNVAAFRLRAESLARFRIGVRESVFTLREVVGDGVS